ncbi:MAG: GNAT family N-acetyltransferase [Lachnospiraceae bacterium]|nr:GNAT family N-acetyltransferase [Lachnospiraceae bacterium]
MIRRLQKTDIDRIADIWLDANEKAHHFITPQYWRSNLKLVKEMFSQGEIYVYEEELSHKIDGFIGMDEDYIAGIFVCYQAQCHGIGKQLLDFVKNIRKQLTLNVYQKNIRAVRFYQRENFHIQSESIDENTGEKEYLMIWKACI